MSPSYRELFGLAPDAPVTYEVWLSHVHPEDRQRCREYGEAFFAGRETDWRLQFRIVRGDGKVRWHRAIGKVYRDADGKPLRFIGVSTDVTEEQRALAALSESEARFRAMADGLPLIVWMHDAEGAQQFVNRTFLEYFDVEEEEMKGGRWQLLMHPEDGPVYAEEFMACVRERKPFHAEVRVRNGGRMAQPRVVGAAALVRGGRVPRHGGHERRCHRAPAHGAGAARRRPAQGRVSGDARPRAAQSPGGHIPGAGRFRLGLPVESPLARTREAAERQTRILIRLVDDLLDSARISTGKIALKRVRLSLPEIARSALETSRLDLQASATNS